MRADLTNAFKQQTDVHPSKEGKKKVHPLQLTLEEVYYGCLKKVSFQRRRITPQDTMETEQRQLTIDVKPGLPEGTRFVFEGCAPQYTARCAHMPCMHCRRIQRLSPLLNSSARRWIHSYIPSAVGGPCRGPMCTFGTRRRDYNLT